MVAVDGTSVPLRKHLASASPHESSLIEPTIETSSVPEKIQRLIHGKAGESDPLRNRLAQRGIDLIAPHIRSRRKKKRQDGRKLRGYKRPWIGERTFAWIGNFRRLVVDYGHKLKIYSAFFHLACLMIVRNRL